MDLNCQQYCQGSCYYIAVTLCSCGIKEEVKGVQLLPKCIAALLMLLKCCSHPSLQLLIIRVTAYPTVCLWICSHFFQRSSILYNLLRPVKLPDCVPSRYLLITYSIWNIVRCSEGCKPLWMTSTHQFRLEKGRLRKAEQLLSSSRRLNSKSPFTRLGRCKFCTCLNIWTCT